MMSWAGAFSIVFAAVLSILGPSLLRFWEGVVQVRIAALDRAGAIDYESARSVADQAADGAIPLAEWVVGGTWQGIYVWVFGISVAFLLLGLVCLLTAVRLPREATDDRP
jgi:hypothetical protein